MTDERYPQIDTLLTGAELKASYDYLSVNKGDRAKLIVIISAIGKLEKRV